MAAPVRFPKLGLLGPDPPPPGETGRAGEGAGYAVSLEDPDRFLAALGAPG